MRLLLGTLTLLLLAGCSADAEPGLQPTEPTAGTTSASPAPATDPLRFTTSSSRTTYSCFPDGPRTFMLFDQVSTDRPVTLTRIAGGGDATTLHGSWLAPLPRRAVPESGAIDLGAGGTGLDDIDAWADRGPLRGAGLEPGRDYTWFVRATLRPDRSLDDLTLGWDDGSSTGGSTFDNRGRTRSGGC